MPSAVTEDNGHFTPNIGAEASIELINWHDRKVIRKIRAPKSYRNSKLDELLRGRRTKEEAEILHLAKLAGVDCPTLLFVDSGHNEILMEFVRGDSLRDLERSGKDMKAKSIQRKWHETLGKYIAKLHSVGIIHGDLTTSNVIITEEPYRLALLDFGLSFISERLEDKAEDLHLLKQALKSSTHPKYAKRAFEIIISSYRKVVGSRTTNLILSQIAEIERRGRYARVD